MKISIVMVLMAALLSGANTLRAACPKSYASPQVSKRGDVYANTPFKAGEVARYEVSYFGVLVGYGELAVMSPRKKNKQWVQVLQAEGKTGDWYHAIFIAHDKIEALSNPVNQEGLHFYIEQKEGKMFGSNLERSKWVDFQQENCDLKERTVEKSKPEKNETFDLTPGSIDVLTGTFLLRTWKYEVGKVQTAPIYTSEKNWQLKAEPLAKETVKVPAGTFQTMKVKLTTYIGQELQQKGDVYVWVATDRPEQPIVKIAGEIKIGSVEMLLKEFKPGK